MDKIEKLPIIIRWILFIPTLLLIYFSMKILGGLILAVIIGSSTSYFSVFIVTVFHELMCLGTAIILSCLMAPRFQHIIAIIYSALLLIYTGSNVTLFFTGQLGDVWTLPFVIGTVSNLVVVFVVPISFLAEWRKNSRDRGIATAHSAYDQAVFIVTGKENK